jgi:nucleotide-binding universal stress UspA family protein
MKPRILVPFDFGPSAEQALAWAAKLQKATGADPIRMVHVINVHPPGTGDVALDVLLPSDDEIAKLERAMVNAAGEHGARATAEVRVRGSAVGDLILDAARSNDSDLIVMGTHGRSGVKRVLLGSVAEHVVRHADCPVVTVHAP